jgi:hypothetical protein
MKISSQDAYWMAWGSYLEHVQPHQGKPCERCIAGSTPKEGCEEGQRLWSEHQKTRTKSYYATQVS